MKLRRPRRRKLTVALVALQIAIPSTLLVARWVDPSIGQQRGGWQMHTVCWGRIESCR